MLNQYSSITRVFVPIHKEGYLIIGITAGIVFLLSYMSTFLRNLGCIILAFVVYFFRNPPRTVTDIEEAIVSPADGLVDQIIDCPPPEELGCDQNKNWVRISIFLNVFNVHSQRVPFGGEVTKIVYHPGKKLNVSLDKNSKDNERNSCVVKTSNNEEIVFVQIAGLIARRIVCNIKQGDKVNKGDLYGIIKFGSRVDLYLPKDKVRVVVSKGQTMIGAETIMAYFKEN